MADISVEVRVLEEADRNMQNAVRSIEETQKTLIRKYIQLGSEWHDAKYRDLGTVLGECNKAMEDVRKKLEDGRIAVMELVRIVRQYEDIHVGDREM